MKIYAAAILGFLLVQASLAQQMVTRYPSSLLDQKDGVAIAQIEMGVTVDTLMIATDAVRVRISGWYFRSDTSEIVTLAGSPGNRKVGKAKRSTLLVLEMTDTTVQAELTGWFNRNVLFEPRIVSLPRAAESTSPLAPAPFNLATDHLKTPHLREPLHTGSFLITAGIPLVATGILALLSAGTWDDNAKSTQETIDAFRAMHIPTSGLEGQLSKSQKNSSNFRAVGYSALVAGGISLVVGLISVGESSNGVTPSVAVTQASDDGINLMASATIRF
jgi:hypothetical protein